MDLGILFECKLVSEDTLNLSYNQLRNKESNTFQNLTFYRTNKFMHLTFFAYSVGVTLETRTAHT